VALRESVRELDRTVAHCAGLTTRDERSAPTMSTSSAASRMNTPG
jgi:hypothetical protein